LATIPVVEQTDEDPEIETVLVAIDLDELEADLRDEDWQDFLRRAKAYRRSLREHGRIRNGS
jgi:hypothetical protein